MQGAQDRQGLDRGERELGRDVGRDRRQPQHPNLQHFPRGLDGKQVFGGVMLNAKDERLAADRLAHGVAMRGQLIANGRSYQVCAVRIKPFLDQKINLAQVDITEIDRDLFVGRLGNGSERWCARRHEHILGPSTWMVYKRFNLLELVDLCHGVVDMRVPAGTLIADILQAPARL